MQIKCQNTFMYAKLNFIVRFMTSITMSHDGVVLDDKIFD